MLLTIRYSFIFLFLCLFVVLVSFLFCGSCGNLYLIDQTSFLGFWSGFWRKISWKHCQTCWNPTCHCQFQKLQHPWTGEILEEVEVFLRPHPTSRLKGLISVFILFVFLCLLRLSSLATARSLSTCRCSLEQQMTVTWGRTPSTRCTGSLGKL